MMRPSEPEKTPQQGGRGIVALLLACVLCLAVGAGGQARADAGPATVGVAVTVIHARAAAPDDVGDRVPESLRALERYLLKSFPTYDRFERLGRHRVEVGPTRTRHLELPNGSGLWMRHEGTRDGIHALHLEVGGLKTTVNVRPGATFFQAGRVHLDGIIVLAFEVARP